MADPGGATRRRKHWGWGYEDEQPSADELRVQAAAITAHLGFGRAEPELPAPIPALAAPRLLPPPELASICSQTPHDRARHALGSSYLDVVAGFRGSFPHPPDAVACPHDEQEVERVLEWALGAGAAVIPYGGGTSVVGGVEPRGLDSYAGVVTLDLRHLDRVLELDEISQAARIQAGASGPALEDQLGGAGMTLRFYPQSFQFSTLGGWIATRAAGHFATGPTHIDDLVESIRAVTPAGIWESRRLPGSGAAVSPDRMLLGSEGALGVLTEAWVRVRPRPDRRASAAVRFPDFAAGAEAVRALAQSGLQPANCRLIDPLEARITGAGDGDTALLVLGFESPAVDVEPAMKAALAICDDHGASWERRGSRGARAPAEAGWREAFLRAPYLRDVFVAAGVLAETFETAITWERFPDFHAAVLAATTEAVRQICGAGTVSCRLTHVYPDGPAPYYTVLAPAREGAERDQWGAIKHAAADALAAAGGTITHHHAVGRDHRPWYDLQRPEPFATAVRAAKRALDPGWGLNPGVLVDPERA